jgi:hypothetical protein
MNDPRRRVRDGLAAITLSLLHLAGLGFAVITLLRAWFLHDAVRLWVTQNAVFRIFAPLWFLIPVGLLVTAALSARELVKVVWRWHRREAELDVGLRLRALAYAGLGCVFVTAFFLSTPESFSGPFRLRFPILGEIVTAFAFGAFLLWSALLPTVRRLVPAGLRRGADLVGMNLALLLVLSEITLRVAAVFLPSPLLVTDHSASQIRRDANRERPGTLRFGFPMNQGGHYDAEFVPRSATPNRVVVGIGDSFSYGAVPHAYHFTTVAERELPGVDIYNMGYSGIGPSDYLYLLEHEARAFSPDLVVVNLFVGNDVTEGPSPSGPPRWYDADNYLLAVVWYRVQIMRRAKLVDAADATRSSDLTREQLAVLYPQLADPLLEKPSVTEELFYAVETRNAEGICLPHDSLYQAFFETLLQIKQAAGKTPVAFLVIPEEFQVEDDIWSELLHRTGKPLDRDLAQRTIVSWLKARHLPVLDLLPLLRAVPPMKDGRRHLYHSRNLHFNARGNELAGRAYARFVDSLLSVSPAPVPLPPRLVFGNSTTRRWMSAGWSQDEAASGRTYVWSNGPQSTLTVPLPRGNDVRMDFEANPFVFAEGPQQLVAVVLNGKEVQQVPLSPGVHQYSVLLPAKELRQGPNSLEFRYAYTRAPHDVDPRSPDDRPLAVAFYSIQFTPSPTAEPTVNGGKQVVVEQQE